MCLIIAWGDVRAQERTVTGKVTSGDDGSPLPGVNVVIKGTATGTVTDINGQYTLGVPSSGGVLVFSFIGFVTQEDQKVVRSKIPMSPLPQGLCVKTVKILSSW